MSYSSLEGDFPYSLSKLWHLQATAVRTQSHTVTERRRREPLLLREQQSSASTVGMSLGSSPNENDSIHHVWRVAITIS